MARELNKDVGMFRVCVVGTESAPTGPWEILYQVSDTGVPEKQKCKVDQSPNYNQDLDTIWTGAFAAVETDEGI